jgi:hypothetical protein
MSPENNASVTMSTAANVIAHRKLAVRKKSIQRTKYESHAAHCMNQGCVTGHVHLAPQSPDMYIDEVGTRIKVVVPDFLEQHRSGDDMPLMPHEVRQQPQLSGLQVQISRAATRRVAQQVNFEIAGA